MCIQRCRLWMNSTRSWNRASRQRELSGSTSVFPRTILARLQTRRPFVDYAGLSSRTLPTPLTWSPTFSSVTLRNTMRSSNRTVTSWFLFALKIAIKLSKAVHAWTSPVCFYARCITQIYTLNSYHGMLGLNVISVPFLTIIMILSW